MNKRNLDHNNYDILNLYVKKEKIDITLDCYQKFGWEKIDESENKIYEDTIDLKFKRVHKLENKDELQYNQIIMENKLNEIGGLENRKHNKSIILSLTLGPIFAIIFGLSLYIAITTQYVALLIIGILSTLLTCVASILFILKIKALVKNENENFYISTSNLYNEINKICENAIKLLGGKYNEQNKNSNN